MTARRAYPSDLSDARWALIAPRLTAWRQARTDAGVSGRTPTHDLRDIFDAILYVNRTGIAWRYLPHDFPPHATVYGYFAAWSKEGIFTELNYQLTGLVRDHHGRTIEPTASIMDSQSVKTSTNLPPPTQGTDAGKKDRRSQAWHHHRHPRTAPRRHRHRRRQRQRQRQRQRHRHQPARPGHHHLPHPDQDLGRRRLQKPFIEHGARLGVDVEIVTKEPQIKGFSVVKRRWVVEHTIGWLMRHRRLVRDHEARPDNSASTITLAMIDNLAKRLTTETTPTWRELLQSPNAQNA